MALAGSARAQTSDPAPGVPLDVATRRAAVIFDLRYDLSLTIPKALADPITGTTRITFDLRDNTTPLVIDFETSRDHVTVGEGQRRDRRLRVRQRPHRLPNTALKVGPQHRRDRVHGRQRLRSIAARTSSTRCSCPHVHGRRFRCSISRT